MIDKHREHNLYQQKIFKDNIDLFREEIPEDVKQRTEAIVAAAQLIPEDRVLDVGTGRGVLISYFQRYGVSEITGCDLNSTMLADARQNYPKVRFWCGDFIDIPESLGPFDAIFFNAMFGNILDQRAALERAVTLLNENGRVVISHPMGASFAEELHRQDPKMVPHPQPLPTEKQLDELIKDLSLRVKLFKDEENLYICILQVLSHQ